MDDERSELEGDPWLLALARLPREDLDSARRERMRQTCRAELQRAVRSRRGGAAAALSSLYAYLLEPTLVAAYALSVLLRTLNVLGLGS